MALRAREAEARLQQQASQVEVLAKDLELARSGDAAHGAMRDALQREVAEARSQADALETQAREAATRAEHLTSQNKELMQQLEEARNRAASLPPGRDVQEPERVETAVTAVAAQAEAAEAKSRQLSAQIELLSSDLRQSLATTEALQRDRDAFERQVAQLTNELEQIRENARECQAGRDALRLRMEEARSEAQLLAARAQQADTQAEQQAWQIEVMGKDLDLARERAAELVARRDLLQRQIEEAGWEPHPADGRAAEGNGAAAAKPNGAAPQSVPEAPGLETMRPSTAVDITANIVRASGLFDAEDYRLRAGVTSEDPAIHYATEGERQGVAPSSRFDPSYYAERYPDVAAAGMCLLEHYAMHGQREGRRALPVAAEFAYERGRFDPDKESILLVSHEASRTGAPVLALTVAQKLSSHYNVVTILLRGGDLVEKFSRTSSHMIVLENDGRNDIEYKYAVDSIRHRQPIRYAIVSSIESRPMMPILGRALIPTVNLIHEFSSYTRPLGAVRESLGWTTELVFSTNATADSFRVEHPGLLKRRLHVLPQGRCMFPPAPPGAGTDTERETLRAAMRPPGCEDAFVVLGAGFVHIRKGVDLFIATAAAAAKLAGKRRRIRFVWIGGGYDPDGDMGYSVYLAEQLARGGSGDHVVILDPVEDLEPAYTYADVFFLSSRLDPMPNVTIEAAMHGLPVVCFEGASGIAEVLKRDATAAKTVVPHLDIHAAARCIVALAKDKALRKKIGGAQRTVAEATFDIDRYIRDIDGIGGLAIDAMRQRRADFETIAADQLFDAAVSLPAHSGDAGREDAIARFLATWSAARIAPQQLAHLDLRRPCAGFNPQIYALHHPQIFDQDVNPLADFIRGGRPEGPWLHRVIRPDLTAPGQSDLRVAIQAHFHYPDLIEEFLAKLAINETRCDLLLSTNDEAKAELLRAAMEDYQRGRAEVRVFPNRGRDIAPFLTGFAEDIVRDYDVIGHLHAKRSLGVDAEMGEMWREFLWQHLLGGRHAMMDVALAHLAAAPALGLVFPEEPHLCDWDENLAVAEEVAARAGLETPLPPFFDFPVGTMFWARPQALEPLFALALGFDDYPAEPLANDGTMLHALERLLPFAAAKQGFSYATLHVPGVTR